MDKLTLTPAEAVSAYINGAKAKVTTPFIKLMIKAIFAGMMIAFGAAGSQMASHAVTNPGLAKLIAGAVFPMGLMMVVLTGSELFTGDCLMGMAAIRKEIKRKDTLRVLILVYIGNFIGSFIVAGLAFLSGQFAFNGGMLGAYAIKTAAAKCSLEFLPALASGILCNILVCAAVFLALTAKEATGKMLACFFIILLFVTSGYEHCVANMFYIPAGLLAKTNPDFVKIAAESFGITAEQISNVNIISMLVNNLLPVTLGNIIGGMFIFGIPLEFAVRKSSEKK